MAPFIGAFMPRHLKPEESPSPEEEARAREERNRAIAAGLDPVESEVASNVEEAESEGG